MFRKLMAAIAAAAALAGCGPSADPDDYFFERADFLESFRVAEIHCRGEVGRSRAWFPGDRQAIFDACMQSRFHWSFRAWVNKRDK